MKFNSVNEYFYKLNNRGYQLMMVPLIIFSFFYSQSLIKLPGLVILNQGISRILLFALGLLSAIVLTIVQLVTEKKAGVITKEVGLGIKLEKLGTVLTRKMVTMSLTVLLMPLALLFTGDSYFSVAFGVLALWYFLQWPTPVRVSRLLKLKGDEKEMVISRGEAFK